MSKSEKGTIRKESENQINSNDNKVSQFLPIEDKLNIAAILTEIKPSLNNYELWFTICIETSSVLWRDSVSRVTYTSPDMTHVEFLERFNWEYLYRVNTDTLNILEQSSNHEDDSLRDHSVSVEVIPTLIIRVIVPPAMDILNYVEATIKKALDFNALYHREVAGYECRNSSISHLPEFFISKKRVIRNGGIVPPVSTGRTKRSIKKSITTKMSNRRRSVSNKKVTRENTPELCFDYPFRLRIARMLRVNSLLVVGPVANSSDVTLGSYLLLELCEKIISSHSSPGNLVNINWVLGDHLEYNFELKLEQSRSRVNNSSFILTEWRFPPKTRIEKSIKCIPTLEQIQIRLPTVVYHFKSKLRVERINQNIDFSPDYKSSLYISNPVNEKYLGLNSGFDCLTLGLTNYVPEDSLIREALYLGRMSLVAPTAEVSNPNNSIVSNNQSTSSIVFPRGGLTMDHIVLPELVSTKSRHFTTDSRFIIGICIDIEYWFQYFVNDTNCLPKYYNNEGLFSSVIEVDRRATLSELYLAILLDAYKIIRHELNRLGMSKRLKIAKKPEQSMMILGRTFGKLSMPLKEAITVLDQKLFRSKMSSMQKLFLSELNICQNEYFWVTPLSNDDILNSMYRTPENPQVKEIDGNSCPIIVIHRKQAFCFPAIGKIETKRRRCQYIDTVQRSLREVPVTIPIRTSLPVWDRINHFSEYDNETNSLDDNISHSDIQKWTLVDNRIQPSMGIESTTSEINSNESGIRVGTFSEVEDVSSNPEDSSILQDTKLISSMNIRDTALNVNTTLNRTRTGMEEVATSSFPTVLKDKEYSMELSRPIQRLHSTKDARQFEFHPTIRGLMVVGSRSGDVSIVKYNNNNDVCLASAKVSTCPVLALCWLRKRSNLALYGASPTGSIGYLRYDGDFGYSSLNSDSLNSEEEDEEEEEGNTESRSAKNGKYIKTNSIVCKNLATFRQLSSISVNATDDHFMTSGFSSSVHLYDLETGKPINRFYSMHDHYINILRCSNIHPHIFSTCSFDSTCKLWDIRQPIPNKRTVFQDISARNVFSENGSSKFGSVWDNIITGKGKSFSSIIGEKSKSFIVKRPYDFNSHEPISSSTDNSICWSNRSHAQNSRDGSIFCYNAGSSLIMSTFSNDDSKLLCSGIDSFVSELQLFDDRRFGNDLNKKDKQKYTLKSTVKHYNVRKTGSSTNYRRSVYLSANSNLFVTAGTDENYFRIYDSVSGNMVSKISVAGVIDDQEMRQCKNDSHSLPLSRQALHDRLLQSVTFSSGLARTQEIRSRSEPDNNREHSLFTNGLPNGRNGDASIDFESDSESGEPGRDDDDDVRGSGYWRFPGASPVIHRLYNLTRRLIENQRGIIDSLSQDREPMSHGSDEEPQPGSYIQSLRGNSREGGSVGVLVSPHVPVTRSLSSHICIVRLKEVLTRGNINDDVNN